MVIRKIAITLLCATAAIVLLSCTATSPVTQAGVASITESGEQSNLKTIYSGLKEAGGKVFTLNPRSSTVRIHVFRAGSAARLGHNHVISAPQFTGFVYLPLSGPASARFDLEFRLDQLELDNPEYRSALGSAFSSVMTSETMESTRNHMLGADNLQADQP